MSRRKLKGGRSTTALASDASNESIFNRLHKDRYVMYPSKHADTFHDLKYYNGNVPPGKYGKVYNSIKRYFPTTNKHTVYSIPGVHDEGNCFYDTISSAMNVDDWHSQSLSKRRKIGLDLRKTIYGSITKKRWETFWKLKKVDLKQVPSYQEIRKQIKNPTTWADVFAILYVADKLHINLLVFDTTTGRLYCGTNQQVEGKSVHPTTVFMAWIAHSHFSPLMEVDTRTMRIKLRFTEHDAILIHVLRLYEKEGCPTVTIHHILRRRRRRQQRGGGGKSKKKLKRKKKKSIRRKNKVSQY